MRDKKLLTKPVTLDSFRIDDLYMEISDHWEQKAKQLQARRWRKLKQQKQSKPDYLWLTRRH